MFGIAKICFHLICFEVLFYNLTKSLPSAIKLFLRSNFLQTICGRKSSKKGKHHNKGFGRLSDLTSLGKGISSPKSHRALSRDWSKIENSIQKSRKGLLFVTFNSLRTKLRLLVNYQVTSNQACHVTSFELQH